MADSKWFTQKSGASTFIKSALADGQEKSIEVIAEGLKAQGVSSKNTLKAIYAEVAAGSAVLVGDWETGKVKKGGA